MIFPSSLDSGRLRCPLRWLGFVLASWVGITAVFLVSAVISIASEVQPFGGSLLVVPAMLGMLICSVCWTSIAAFVWIRSPLGRVVALALIVVVSTTSMQMIGPSLGLRVSIWQNLLNFMVIIAIALALRAGVNGRRATAKLKEAEALREAAEQRVLRTQLAPHTLFNVINTLYAVSLTAPDRMPPLLLSFAEFFRHVAKAGECDFVSIDDEVSYMKACKALALARAAPGSHVELTTNGGDDERVVPLMIGGLFENALKNGFLPDGRLMVTAELTIDDRGIAFCVRNPCLPGVGVAKGLGYGNRLLQRRLNLHYPGRHSYSFGAVRDEYVVELSLW